MESTSTLRTILTKKLSTFFQNIFLHLRRHSKPQYHPENFHQKRYIFVYHVICVLYNYAREDSLGNVRTLASLYYLEEMVGREVVAATAATLALGGSC